MNDWTHDARSGMKLIALVLGVSGASHALSADDPPAPNDRACCTSPSCSGQGFPASGIQYAYEARWLIEPMITTTLTPEPWISCTSTPCALLPCSQVPPPGFCDAGKEVKQSTCWSGSSKATIPLSLFLANLVDASIEVEAGYSQCHEETQRLPNDILRQHCWKHFGRFVKVEKRVHASVEYTHRCTYTCYNAGGNPFPGSTECVQVVSSSVVHTPWPDIDIAPLPSECGGQIPDPDPSGGKRAEPCCPSVIPCVILAPGEQPCCGCYVDQ